MIRTTVKQENAEGVASENSQRHFLEQEIALTLILIAHAQSSSLILKKLDRRLWDLIWNIQPRSGIPTQKVASMTWKRCNMRLQSFFYNYSHLSYPDYLMPLILLHYIPSH